MEVYHYLAFAFISFITALMSAATGMGGGVIFLVGINLYFPLSSSIAIHGLIQFFNNFIRVIKLRSYLQAKSCIPFLLGAVIGVSLITFIFVGEVKINKVFPYSLILALVMYSIFKPKKMPELIIGKVGFFVLGIVTGFLGLLIGAVDPILSPFFLRHDFSRQQVIANKSFFQTIIHLSKIPVFISIGYSYFDNWQVITVLLISGFVGTLLGISLLERISRRVFITVFKTILFLVGLKLAYNIFEMLAS